MSELLDEYSSLESPHRKYEVLRAELARLRGAAHEADDGELYDRDEVAATLRDLNDSFDGELIAFVANDFGLPIAYRPDGTPATAQEEIRQELLQEKYQGHDDLNALRTTLLDRFPAVHKAIMADSSGDDVRYHLPEGSTETTNFLTVREMVGLIDYTTNSAQSDGLSLTY